MGSRIRNNPDHLFECFCEVGIAQDESALILQKYPSDYNQNEVLKCIPQFAYPCRFNVDTVTHFSFVLTNIDSKWTFGFCRHAPNSQTCIVILSYLPWHSTFFKILNQCYELTNKEASYLFRFLDSLYECEVPEPGLSLAVTYCTNTKVYEFSSPTPDHHKIPSIPEDRNLTEYFNAIDHMNMITIFANMLNERRILITSKNLCRLSSCVQAANSLIYPMHWQHIFIPVLPNHLLDYLSAPMPFLIGVPSITMTRVKRSDLGDIVILDVDENRIESPFDDVQMLPTDIIQLLKKSLKNPISMLGDGVARAFLRALVMLIGGYREALKFTFGEKITFNFETFVNTRPPSIQPFLTKMLQLQIFQQFIEGRLEMLNSGEGFSDEFEFELNMYEDKGANRLRIQYKEWLNTAKKEGGAILKSVNPVVKSAYRQVKRQSKRAYKDLRLKIQSNNNTQQNQPSYSGRSTSEPSSPKLTQRGIKKSVSGSVIGKTDKTVTYVRERRPSQESNKIKSINNDISKLHNGFINSSTTSTSSSLSAGTSSSLTQSYDAKAPEASPEQSDIESSDQSNLDQVQRVEIDLLGEIQDYFTQRTLLEDIKESKELGFKDFKDPNSSSSSSNRSSSINKDDFTLSSNPSSSSSSLKPIPPPRPPQIKKPLNGSTDRRINDKGNKLSGETLLIELDSPSLNGDNNLPDDIFDPLFEDKHSKSTPPKLSDNWFVKNDLNSLWKSSSTSNVTNPLNKTNLNAGQIGAQQFGTNQLGIDNNKLSNNQFSVSNNQFTAANHQLGLANQQHLFKVNKLFDSKPIQLNHNQNQSFKYQQSTSQLQQQQQQQQPSALPLQMPSQLSSSILSSSSQTQTTQPKPILSSSATSILAATQQQTQPQQLEGIGIDAFGDTIKWSSQFTKTPDSTSTFTESKLQSPRHQTTTNTNSSTSILGSQGPCYDNQVRFPLNLYSSSLSSNDFPNQNLNQNQAPLASSNPFKANSKWQKFE